jgi:hypothetical protein
MSDLSISQDEREKYRLVRDQLRNDGVTDINMGISVFEDEAKYYPDQPDTRLL